jgi:hypothetical protein
MSMMGENGDQKSIQAHLPPLPEMLQFNTLSEILDGCDCALKPVECNIESLCLDNCASRPALVCGLLDESTVA